MKTCLPLSTFHLLLFILLIAAFSRLWQLASVPPGFTHDEAGHGQDAAAILQGIRPFYFTVGYGREPLYDYLTAGVMAWLGTGPLTGRWTSAALSMILLVVVYVWVKRACGVRVALLTAAGLAVSFWAVSTGRQALRSGTLPVMYTLAIYGLWRGLTAARRNKAMFALGGLALGLTFYTYLAARTAWVALPLFAIYIAVFQRKLWRRHRGGMALYALIALAAALPLFAYLFTHPGVEQRVGNLLAPLQSPQKIGQNILAGLGVFTLQGDPLWWLNLPGKPVFDWIGGALFYAGIAWCLWNWKQPACALALIWLAAGWLPVLITGLEGSVTRLIAAQPVVYLFPALAIEAFARRAGRYRNVLFVAAAGWLAVTAMFAFRDYFGVWANAPDVRGVYQTNLVHIARYLETRTAPQAIVLSSVHPDAYHDPYVFARVTRGDIRPRWFDGRSSLIFPAAQTALAVIPRLAPLDPALADLFNPAARRITRVELRPTDYNAWFDVYEWNPPNALARALAGATPLQAEVGGVVELLGYTLLTPEIAPGGQVELLTFWRVHAPLEWKPGPNGAPLAPQVVLFTHLVDGNTIIGQQDRLDAPAWDWQPHDAFVQLHRFATERDVSPGVYDLEIGMYFPDTLERLPVYTAVGQNIESRSIVLGPVQVSHAP